MSLCLLSFPGILSAGSETTASIEKKVEKNVEHSLRKRRFKWLLYLTQLGLVSSFAARIRMDTSLAGMGV
jgi:hypothetical protein